MKFTRPHKLNGHQHDTGDPFRGNTSLGRFLYQRKILEPDGAPEDDAITAKQKPSAWHPDHPEPEAPEATETGAPKRTRRRAAAKKEE